MKVDLRRYDNSWYDHGPLLKRLGWMACSIIFFESPWPWPVILKNNLLRAFGAQIGQGCMIKPEVKIKYPWRLIVGDFVWIGERVWIDNLANVRIDSNACISQGAMLLTGNHDYAKPTFDLIIGEIHLLPGVWIGAWAVVCPGVTCYENAVLSVKSVATRNLDAAGIYQGNPAQLKKSRI